MPTTTGFRSSARLVLMHTHACHFRGHSRINTLAGACDASQRLQLLLGAQSRHDLRLAFQGATPSMLPSSATLHPYRSNLTGADPDADGKLNTLLEQPQGTPQPIGLPSLKGYLSCLSRHGGPAY